VVVSFTDKNQNRTKLANIFKTELTEFNTPGKKKEKKSVVKKKNFDVLNRTHMKLNNTNALLWNELKETNHL